MDLNSHQSQASQKILAIVFFLSGLSGLIYQVTWQRLLTLYYGVGHISTTIIVSVFMFGLGLGAYAAGQVIDQVKHRLLIFFIIELLIGVFGILSLPILEFIGAATAGSDYIFVLIYTFAFLAIPTILMGMTLPVLCKIFSGLIDDFLKNISFLYFINILGAALGSIFCSYVLISFWGLDMAVYFAAIINFLLAAGILYVAIIQKKSLEKDNGAEWNKSLDDSEQGGQSLRLKPFVAYVIIFCTGFIALGYEIIWFRLISVLTKASPYAFSSTLGVYLLGVALGSHQINKMIKQRPGLNNPNTFYALQVLIAFYVCFSIVFFYYGTQKTLLKVIPYASFKTELHPTFSLSPVGFASGADLLAGGINRNFITDFFLVLMQNFDCFLWPLYFLFIPTLLMGAAFPLMNSLVCIGGGKEGRTVGNLYFFNILGNVLGGLITGFLLLVLFKTCGTMLIFIVAGSLFVFLMNFSTKKSGFHPEALLKKGFVFCVIVVFISFFPRNEKFYASMHFADGKSEVHVEEGIDSVVVALVNPESKGDYYVNYISGLQHGKRARPGPYCEREMLDALSHVSSRQNVDVLIIEFGVGMSTETAQALDQARVTIVELSATLMENSKHIPETERIMAHAKSRFVIDDGRRYLMQTKKLYDIIFMDPLRPTTMYSNNIYSRDFFRLVRSHLKENGVFGLYVEQEYGIMPKTVLSEFKHAKLFDYFMIASNQPLVEYRETFEKSYHTIIPKPRSQPKFTEPNIHISAMKL